MNKQKLNLAVAADMGLETTTFTNNNDVYVGNITWEDFDYLFDITTGDTQLNDYVEFKRINIRFRSGKVLEDWSADGFEIDIFTDKSRKVATLKCICAIHGVDYE